MSEPSQESSLFSLDNLIYMVFRRKWLLLLGLVAAGAGMAAVYNVLQSNGFYESRAEILVRYVTDTTEIHPSTEGVRVVRPGDHVINSEVAILTSRDLAKRVVRTVGLEPFAVLAEGEPPPTEEMAAAKLLSNLSVGKSRDSSIISLRYRADDPRTAHRVLDTFIDVYLDRHQEIHSAAASYEYFSQRRDQLKAELRTAEEALQEMKNEQHIVSIAENKQMLLERLERIRQTIEAKKGELAAAEARSELLQKRLGEWEEGEDAEAEGAQLSAMEQLRRRSAIKQLIRLREREVDLLSAFNADSMPVRSVQRQIAEAEETLGLQAGRSGTLLTDAASRDALREGLLLEESQVVSSEALLQVLEQQREETLEEMRRLNNSENRIVDYERQVAIKDGAFRRFSDALDVARNQLALSPDQLSNITEIEPATLPLQPTMPNLKKPMLMAGMAGFGLFGGLALLLEMVSAKSLRRPKEVETVLNVPTLMTFPFSPAFRRPIALSGTGKLLPPGQKRSARSRSPEEPRSLAKSVECHFEALYHQVELSGALKGDVPHLIGVTSCQSGSGATTVASGLALAMSQQDPENVLLVDGNLGSGIAHRVLGVPETASLSSVLLSGEKRSVQVQERLHLISAGNGHNGVHQVSLGRRFREFVKELKSTHFTTVVMDLPPINETSATLPLAGLLDGVILVVESEQVSRRRALDAVRLLRHANANVIGVVFNKKRDYVPGWLDVTE